MPRYRLHARKMIGGLATPTHDETRTLQGPDLARLEAEAARLGDEGFTVGIYEGEGRDMVSVHRTPPAGGTRPGRQR